MVSLMGCIIQGREDVFALEEWVIREDFLERGSRAEQFEHIRNTNALAANAGSAPALPGFDGDSIQAFEIHAISRYFDDTQSAVQRQGREDRSRQVRRCQAKAWPYGRLLGGEVLGLLLGLREDVGWDFAEFPDEAEPGENL